MHYFYVFKFLDYPEYFKIGVTSDIHGRIEGTYGWGNMLYTSYFFETTSKSLVFEIEKNLKSIFKIEREEISRHLGKYAGYTEFLPIEAEDFVNALVCSYRNHPSYTEEERKLAQKSMESIIEYDEEVLPNKGKTSITKAIRKVGGKLKSFRLSYNLSVEALSEKSGLSRSVIVSAEAGKCRLEVLVSLLQIYDQANWIHSLPEVSSKGRLNPYNKKPRLYDLGGNLVREECEVYGVAA